MQRRSDEPFDAMVCWRFDPMIPTPVQYRFMEMLQVLIGRYDGVAKPEF